MKTSNPSLIIGIGEVLWDMLPEGKKLGGAPANFAYHISQFSLSSKLVSAIGPDQLGTEILNTINQKHLSHNLAQVPYPTGTVQVQLDQNGIPVYDIKQNVAWDNIPFTDQLRSLAQQTKAICFGSLAQRNIVSRNTILEFIDAIPTENQPLIVFDVNLRQSFYSAETLHESLLKANILKINDEELVIVNRLFQNPGIDLARQCQHLINTYSLRALILTCGVNGSYVFTPDGRQSYLPTPKVQVADTVGAGDSFTAAFIASLLKGATIEQAHNTAVQTSAYVCTCHGAMPQLPASITNIAR